MEVTAMSNAHDRGNILGPVDDPWDVFALDDEVTEAEPEYGDFWGEVDDDCDIGG